MYIQTTGIIWHACA